MKTKVSKSEVRDLVLKVREGLGRKTGKARASRDSTARALRVSAGTIYNWERGNSLPSSRMFEELKRAAIGAPPASRLRPLDLESLSDMIRAISKCGRERAREVFDRALESTT